METVVSLSKNKFFTFLLVIALIITSSTFILSPSNIPNPPLNTITVPGKGTFDLTKYPFLDRRVIGLVNALRDLYKVTDMSNESVNDLSMLPPYLTQYFLAFTIYGLSQIVDSTPGFRTNYYMEIFHKLIAMMNSSEMEYLEWIKPGYASELYADFGNGFRGPTNIMWTGHYALMQLLYYRLFHDARYLNETKWFLNDWNTSLTANETWDGRPSNGLGRWGVGLIPCEPYIVFVQCNSIPFYTMRLYDMLFGTNYQEASLPGIQWWQENMVDQNGIPIEDYFVSEPPEEEKASRSDLPSSFPGPAMTPGMNVPKVAAYGSAWTIMFYKAMGLENIANKYYVNWKKLFIRYTTDGMAYVPNSYHKPNEFGIYEIIGNIFAYFVTREMGDLELSRKIEKWFYRLSQGSWNGYKYEFDVSAFGDLGVFMYPILNFVWAWGHAHSTLSDLMTPRPDDFFTKPYISNQSTIDGLFVYQAYYDDKNDAFILTVEANSNTILTFSNFQNVQGVYTVNGEYTNWNQNGDQLILTLSPGIYSFVIINQPG